MAWGYCDCVYPSFVSLKEFGVVGLDTYTQGIKDFHKCWTGSLAKRRLCLGPVGVINCTPLSAKKKKKWQTQKEFRAQEPHINFSYEALLTGNGLEALNNHE